MSSIYGLGSMNNLLATLRQQLLGDANSNAVTGQADTDGDADGSPGASPASLLSNTSAAAGGAGVSPIDPSLITFLIKLQEQHSAPGNSPQIPTLSPREQQVFSQIDTNGDGQISQGEFEAALASVGGDTTTADALFAKVDANGDGSVTQTEFAAVLPPRHHHTHMRGMARGGGISNAPTNLLGGNAPGDTSSTVTNPDGSTTTTITYADGTKVAVTTPVPSGGTASTDSGSGGTATVVASDNQGTQNPMGPEALIEMLIKLQAQMLQNANSQTGNATVSQVV